MPKIMEMKKICQTTKTNRNGKKVLTGHWYNVLITRKISIYFTWLFIKLGISANHVSILMIFTGLIGILLCIPHNLYLNILGIVFMYQFLVLDCSDGEVARWSGKGSVKGVWLDLISHVFFNHLAKAIPGLHLYFMTQNKLYLFLAFIAYVFSISEHSIRKCQVQLKIDKSEIKVNDSKSIFARLYRFFGFILRQLRDIIVLETLIFIALLLLYVGYNQPIVWITRLIPIIAFVDMINTIFYIYRNELPEIYHNTGRFEW